MNTKESSSLKVFSIIQNLKKTIEQNKDTVYDKLVNPNWFYRTSKYAQGHCSRIYNDIENSFFGYKEFGMFILYNYIWENKFDLKTARHKIINTVNRLFTKEQFIIDQQFILEVNQQVKLNTISAYFKINRDGRSFVYDLIIEKHISPIFYLMFTGETFEKSEFEESNELKRFKKTTNKIKEIF